MNAKASIIIIEDEKNICNFIETVLTPQNYHVVCAYTGADGLKQINTHKPDVVLLDLGLPDMDGLEIIEEVRTYSSVPIIVISARTLEKSKIAALDLGADDYLTADQIVLLASYWRSAYNDHAYFLVFQKCTFAVCFINNKLKLSSNSPPVYRRNKQDHICCHHFINDHV